MEELLPHQLKELMLWLLISYGAALMPTPDPTNDETPSFAQVLLCHCSTSLLRRHSLNVGSEVTTFFDRKERRELAYSEGNSLSFALFFGQIRKSTEPKDFVNPGFTMKRGNFLSTAASTYHKIWFCIFGRLAGFSSNPLQIRPKSYIQTAHKHATTR
ncbi:hypothetical protein M5K25_021473 [Dendrobium thyrsiflorum]|uniref:Secreted protein n=1 Tax=Dendrobium thyrsiflorum TaxID=117978 RepID=A0ABD0UD50_DENTH